MAGYAVNEIKAPAEAAMAPCGLAYVIIGTFEVTSPVKYQVADTSPPGVVILKQRQPGLPPVGGLFDVSGRTFCHGIVNLIE